MSLISLISLIMLELEQLKIAPGSNGEQAAFELRVS